MGAGGVGGGKGISGGGRRFREVAGGGRVRREEGLPSTCSVAGSTVGKVAPLVPSMKRRVPWALGACCILMCLGGEPAAR